MFRFSGRTALLAILCLTVTAGTVGAQGRNPIRRIRTQGPAAPDLGLFGLNSWDRTILGARSRGMGGVCLALPAEAASPALNPSGLSELTRPQLTSGTRARSGSSSSSNVPAAIPGPDATSLDVSNVRPALTSSYSYNNLSFAIPLLILERPAGIGLSYRRIVDFRTGWESRFAVDSPFGDANFGLGNTFTGGLDAITPALGVRLSDRLSVGAGLNLLSGTITENGNQGVTVFGQVFSRGGLFFSEDVSGTSLDLGSQLRVSDRLTLGAVLQPGYDLEFRGGFYSIQLLPQTTAPQESLSVIERPLLDHTMSVPTQFGVGAAYKLGDRITLGVDYWNRSWSKATMTRDAFTTQVFFPDSNNLFNTVVRLTPTGRPAEKDLMFQDTHHFRLGVEWKAINSEDGGFRMPVRVGFRREPMTFADYSVDSLQAFWGYVGLVSVNPFLTNAQKRELVTTAVDYLNQQGINYLTTDNEVTATTITVGTGAEVGNFSVDVAFTRTSYTVVNLFTGAFSDYTLSPSIHTAREKRSINELNISSTLRF